MKMVIRALLAAAILVLGYGIHLIDAAAVRGSSSINSTTSSLDGVPRNAEEPPVLELKTPQIMKRKHYDWCKASLDECTTAQVWLKQVVLDNRGRLERMTANYKLAMAHSEENKNICGLKPREVAARGIIGGGGGLIPGLSPAYEVFDAAVSRLTDWLNPPPRNCTQTELCYQDVRTIIINAHEQLVNMTKVEQDIADYAAQSTQCIDEQVEAYRHGLQPRSGSVVRRDDSNRREAKEVLNANTAMCGEIREWAHAHQQHEQEESDKLDGMLARGHTGNKPPPDRECTPRDEGRTREKRKVWPEDLDELKKNLGNCRKEIQTSLDSAKMYNEKRQDTYEKQMDPIMYLWHDQRYLPAINDTPPICPPKKVQPTFALDLPALPSKATTRAGPLDNPPALPPRPTTGMSSMEETVSRQHGTPEAAALIKRGDKWHKQAIDASKDFTGFLHHTVQDLLDDLKQCRIDKTNVVEKLFGEHYECEEDLISASASIMTLSKLAQKTVIKTITETSEAKLPTASGIQTTMTTTVIATITASACINTQGVNKAVTSTSTAVGTVPASKDKPMTTNPGGESGSMVPAAMVSVPASKSDVSSGPIISTGFISVTPSSQLVKSPEPSSSASTPTTSEANLVATIPNIPTG